MCLGINLLKKHRISPPHFDNCILLLKLPYFWRHSIQLPTIVSLSTFLPVCSYWLTLPTVFHSSKIKILNMKSNNNIYGLKKEHELRYKDYLN